MSASLDELLERLGGETLQGEDEDELSLELRPPASEQALTTTEQRIGRAIPAGFRAFLKRTNGASFFGEEILGNPSFAGTKELLDAGLLPFHPWGNGDYDALDLNRMENGEPVVVYCNHGPHFTVAVAKSFAEWCELVFDEIKAEGAPAHPSDYMHPNAHRKDGIYAHVPQALAGKDCELWATYGAQAARRR